MSTAIAIDGLVDIKRNPARVYLPAPSRVWKQQYLSALRVSDVAVVICAVLLAQWLRFGTAPGSGWRLLNLSYLVASAVVAAIWVLFLAIYRTRAQKILGAGPEEYQRVAAATLSAFGTIAIVSMLTKVDLARGYLAIALPAGFIGLLVSRRVARQIVSAKRRRGECLTSVLVVGELGRAQALMNSLSRTPEYGYAAVGVCVPGHDRSADLRLTAVDGVPVFGVDDLAESVAASGADTVVLTTTEGLGSQGISDLSWQLEKLDVDIIVSPGMVGLAGPRLTMRPVADLPLIHLDKPQYDGAKRLQKRAFDICFSLALLVFALPVLIVAAAAVKLTSRGPIFYRSERIGIDGQPFQMIKFRTMVDGADRLRAGLAQLNEVNGGGIFKIKADPRITPVGRYLRRYSIDELPQFINVLRREMSVVGPRPPLRSEVETYDHRVRRRLLVRPGITGLWQVSGRSDLCWNDVVRLDLSYVENWSMMSDLIIAIKTVRAVFSAKGAY